MVSITIMCISFMENQKQDNKWTINQSLKNGMCNSLDLRRLKCIVVRFVRMFQNSADMLS